MIPNATSCVEGQHLGHKIDVNDEKELFQKHISPTQTLRIS